MAENKVFVTELNKMMALCSRREFCKDDIRSKLLLSGIGNNDSDKIIGILLKENFINELRYAIAFTNDKFNYNKWGKLKIAAHLNAKRIPHDIVQSALDSIDNAKYTTLIKDLVFDHSTKIKAKNKYELKAKLFRYGHSKGFESNLLYDILNELAD